MKDELRRFLVDDILDGNEGRTIGDDEDLLLSGLLDSIGAMRLVAFIESTFGVTVPPEDLTIETFSSLNALEAYLGSRADDARGSGRIG